MGGLTSDAIGRKKTLLLSSVFFSVGWVVIAQATEVSELLVGRMLTGIASGFYSVTVQVINQNNPQWLVFCIDD